ncbi:MAG: hypothetical protein IT385_22470 [Deltaproteobacteria bacterium]|nr:hypothetical protein [Deltaproteobacteria bacterium]
MKTRVARDPIRCPEVRLSNEVDPIQRRRALLRKVAPLVLIAFVGVGVWLYRQRMPQDVGLRLVVPPTLHHPAGSFPREGLVALDGSVTSEDGVEVATFRVPLDGGLDTPLAPPIGLQLRRGAYTVTARARDRLGAVAPLGGRVEIGGDGEARVELARRLR